MTKMSEEAAQSTSHQFLVVKNEDKQPLEELKKKIRRMLAHAQKRADETKERHGDTPNQTHNYYGGRAMGYWNGTISAYENILVMLDSVFEVDE